MRTLVTGGAGFIGSALVRHLVGDLGETVLTIDALTYAGNLESLKAVAGNPRHDFRKADIRDFQAMADAIAEFRPDRILHLAAERWHAQHVQLVIFHERQDDSSPPTDGSRPGRPQDSAPIDGCSRSSRAFLGRT